MLFMIGIEPPANKNEAYGAVVPVFAELGFGCHSAADKEADILNQAKTAILEMAEEMLTDGRLLSELEQGYKDYSSEYPEFTRWVALDVAIDELKPVQHRLNIMLPKPQLIRIDDFVSTHNEYKDRSDFLSIAASKLMQSSP
jgi:hypothetical protein